jgi:hypothetical protein
MGVVPQRTNFLTGMPGVADAIRYSAIVNARNSKNRDLVWLPADLRPGWDNADGHQPLEYTRHPLNGTTILRGAVKVEDDSLFVLTGDVWPIFDLPATYRPEYLMSFFCPTEQGGRIIVFKEHDYVYGNGLVGIPFGAVFPNEVWLSFSGIQFPFYVEPGLEVG